MLRTAIWIAVMVAGLISQAGFAQVADGPGVCKDGDTYWTGATGATDCPLTSYSAVVRIRALGFPANRPDPPCPAPIDRGRNSNCSHVRVELQPGAQICGVRYFTSDDGGQTFYPPVQPGSDLRYARFNRARICTRGGHTWVEAVYKNWHDSRARTAKLEVDWKLPDASPGGK